MSDRIISGKVSSTGIQTESLSCFSLLRHIEVEMLGLPPFYQQLKALQTLFNSLLLTTNFMNCNSSNTRDFLQWRAGEVTLHIEGKQRILPAGLPSSFCNLTSLSTCVKRVWVYRSLGEEEKGAGLSYCSWQKTQISMRKSRAAQQSIAWCLAKTPSLARCFLQQANT